jgi:deoxyribonuclease V
VKKAHKMQRELSKKLFFEDNLQEDEIEYIAGVDLAYFGDLSIGATVVLDYSDMSLVESEVVCTKTRIPYVPTLLSFREIPPAYLALKKLQIKPDVIMVDGQGYAHPYGLGFASHLGLILNKPTIGVAKSLLCGKVEQTSEPKLVRPLKNKSGNIIGAEVITKQGTKPVYVSVGHMISLKTATEIVLKCATKYRLPEPVRKAHITAKNEKKKLRE